MNKRRGITLLRTVIEDINDDEISTHSLLLRCLEAQQLIDPSSHQKSWILQEVTGYEDQNEVNTNTLPQYKRLPHYRWIEIPSKIQRVGKNELYEIVSPFGVSFPCEMLEQANDDIELHFAAVIKPETTWEKITRGTQVLSATGVLPLHRIKSIVKSIRGFVYNYAVSTLATSEFNESFSEIIDNTRKFISTKLEILSKSLLKLINETLDSSSKATEKLRWRVLLENNRTILRRFTGLILTESMLTDSPPKEGDTSKKSGLILDWCRIQLEGKKQTETESLRKEIRIILDLVNKPIHGEISDTSRREVERIILRSLIWIAGIIDVLDSAGYNWISKEDTVNKV
ncbi:MAG: AbiTii domain-containing protein [Candidatus Thorarchaeota archaeon]